MAEVLKPSVVIAVDWWLADLSDKACFRLYLGSGANTDRIPFGTAELKVVDRGAIYLPIN